MSKINNCQMGQAVANKSWNILSYFDKLFLCDLLTVKKLLVHDYENVWKVKFTFLSTIFNMTFLPQICITKIYCELYEGTKKTKQTASELKCNALFCTHFSIGTHMHKHYTGTNWKNHAKSCIYISVKKKSFWSCEKLFFQ